MPAVSARSRTAPPAAAAKRKSESRRISIRLGSVVTGLRESYVAGFPAIRAVIQTVHAQAYVVHSFANAAVLFARALVFRLVALRTQDWTVGHRCLQNRLYLTPKRCGKERMAIASNIFVMRCFSVRRTAASLPAQNALQLPTRPRPPRKWPLPARKRKSNGRCGQPEIPSALA